MFNVETKTSDYMSVIVTHRCNRDCPFCVDCRRNNESPFINEVSVSVACAAAKKLGIKDILLVGGEPTLHPHIVKIAREFKHHGFRVILTTNGTNLERIYELDKYVDCFNISHYGQEELPDPQKMKADVTISKLIHGDGSLSTKEHLDEFIDRYEANYNLKFSTLTNCNLYTQIYQRVEYLDDLESEYIILFNEIVGQIYRGHVIKRYDKIINHNAEQSYKFHVDGTLTKEW